MIFFIIFSGSFFWVSGQSLTAFKSKGKWGYRRNGSDIIQAQYDTAFAFDKQSAVAMVANISDFNSVNPLTGEEQTGYDYCFINAQNKKIKILPENFPDSVSFFKGQQELTGNYKEPSPVFKVLFNDKIYLVSKQGRQLSTGYDNIYESPLKHCFVIENYTEKNGKQIRIRGLIDSLGHIIAKCHYGTIKINPDDSVIYCCGSLFSGNANDDVLTEQGKVIYSDKRHVEFASKSYYIFKEYEPKVRLIYESARHDKTKIIEGNSFFYLKHNKALIVDKDEWFVMDLLSLKKTKVNKEEYFKNLVTLYND